MTRMERVQYAEDELCPQNACEAERTVSNITSGFN